MSRNLVLVLALLCLGGCRMATSERPLFTVADAADAPVLKPGLWALVETGCRFNTKTAPEKWPDCATPLSLRDGAAVAVKRGESSRRNAVLIAGGDPVVLQADATDEGGAAGRKFAYFGLRPLAADEDGTVTRARVWPAECPVGKGAADTCVVRGQAAARRTVAQSETAAYAGTPQDAGRIAYWIRDSDR
jgi:hypothetical protein